MQLCAQCDADALSHILRVDVTRETLEMENTHFCVGLCKDRVTPAAKSRACRLSQVNSDYNCDCPARTLLACYPGRWFVICDFAREIYIYALLVLLYEMVALRRVWYGLLRVAREYMDVCCDVVF